MHTGRILPSHDVSVEVAVGRVALLKRSKSWSQREKSRKKSRSKFVPASPSGAGSYYYPGLPAVTAPCRPQPVRNTGPIPSTPFLSTASLLPPPHLPFSLSCVLIEYFGPLFARFSPVWSLSGPDPDWNFLSDSYPRPLPQFCTPNSRRGSSPTPVLPPSCLGSPISQISLTTQPCIH